jgi:hypothetical protein
MAAEVPSRTFIGHPFKFNKPFLCMRGKKKKEKKHIVAGIRIELQS